MNVEIVWDGDEKVVPGYGRGVKGNVLTMPELIAHSYVEQGLAHYNTEEVQEVVSKDSKVKVDKLMGDE